jgi:SAM-dependent methyltransferase
MAEASWEGSVEAWIRRIDAGEPNRELLLDPVMLDLCSDVRGLRVLDVGCGEGRFSRMLEGRGAAPVAMDPTPGLIAAARSRGKHPCVRGRAEALPFADARFDLVVSYLSLVDIEGYRRAITEMDRVLAPGGSLVLCNTSFVSAASPWVRDEQGRRLYRPIDRYMEERSQHLEWAGISIINWHRPLSAYMEAFLGAGLLLERFVEPLPADESLRDDPYCEDWFRLPEFVAMRWRKPA